jgi:hypothetical protein
MPRLTQSEAHEIFDTIGMYMDARFSFCDVEQPIQSWDIPRKEKVFFTVYSMNLVLESDGFNNLGAQPKVDLDAFFRLLIRFDAQKTADSVVSAIKMIRETGTCNEDHFIRRYHISFLREKVWMKLCHYISGPIFRRYAERSQRIIDRGGSVLNPKEWPRDWNGVYPPALNCSMRERGYISKMVARGP